MDPATDIAPPPPAVDTPDERESGQVPPAAETSLGPFSSAVTSVLICAVLIVFCKLGMPINNVTVLGILVPAMSIACILLFVSLGWIFLLIGRTKIRPKWVAGTGVAIVIAMLEMMTLTYLAGQVQ
jgi:hypothetical protein